MRGAAEPLIAIVRLRKDKAWVLPKGKLKHREDARAAAEREVEGPCAALRAMRDATRAHNLPFVIC